MDVQDEALVRLLMGDEQKMGYEIRWTDREMMAVQRYLHRRMDEMEGPFPIKYIAGDLESMDALYQHCPP